MNTLGCVDECGVNQINMTDSQVHNLKFCRNKNIYVNPDSIEILELGTRKYPYKNLMLPFIELANFHSYKDVAINIYVHERSNIEIVADNIYIVDVQKVNLVSYSAVDPNPAPINLVVKVLV